MAPNKALVLKQAPDGFPVPGTDLVIERTETDLNAPPPPGGLILKTNYVSYDPFLRGKMRPPNPGSYVTGFKHNEPINNNSISTVHSSDNPRFKKGDVVIGDSKFQEYVAVAKERADKDQTVGGFSLLENPLGLDPKIFLGALGMSGLTAYSSFYEIGKPKKGETIFVSAASGAVGQIVGQLAKREGLKVIGSVGSDEKLKFITEELGFDAGFNYKAEKPGDALKRLLKEVDSSSLDIYYDNVGGEQLDAAIPLMTVGGRIGIYYPSVCVTTQLTLSSMLWLGFPVIEEARRNTFDSQHASSRCQAIDDQRISRLRQRIWSKVLGRASKECSAVDQGR